MENLKLYLPAAAAPRKAKEIFEKLKEHDIYVRHWNKERISNYLRITIGTDEQMDALIAALKEILGK